MKKQSQGWWGIVVSAALLVPALTPGPAAAGPFSYVSAADNQKNQAQQEQDRRQAEERDRQQREQQARQRGEQEQRSRQEQQARQAQEQQARQAQERQAGEERQRQQQQQLQRQAERQQQQQRQAEQQQQLQRQAEQQRAERQRQAEQQREIERQRQAEHAQQERMRAVQQQQQQTEQQRQRQEQPTNEQQAQQLRIEQRAREEQLRRAREEQTAREQVRRARDEQAGAARRVSTGPFDYIRRTDAVRSQSQPQSQAQQPVPRESRPGREEQRSVPRSTPFRSVPVEAGRSPRTTVPQGSRIPYNSPSYRPSPFGTVRPGTSPSVRPPGSHSEISRPTGSFPPNAGSPRGTFPGGTVRPGPFGNGRAHREVATPVPPIRRGGHGSLDSYFGRPPRRHRETGRGGYYPAPYYPGGYYPDPYGSYYPYGPGYYYPSPYDYYPPTVYYPVPGPTIIETPAPDVVVVPAPETVIEPEAVESVSLDDVIADVEEAWEGGKLDLLMRHLLQEGQVQIYRDGEWVDSMSRAQFEQKTEQAFRDYDTVSMRFEKPELLGDDENGAPRARARATHIYKTRSGQERRATVTYAFRRYGRAWRIVGLDYEPQPRQRAALPPPSTEGTEDLKGAAASLAGVPSHAVARHPRAATPELHLASAPAVRVRDLLRAHQPRPIATMKWVQVPRKTVYTLQAMRGIAPGTIAWALYRQGGKRPVETGVTDITALPPNGRIAVRVQQPQLVTLASSSPARPRSARLTIHSFAGTGLVLTAAHAPVRAAPRGRHRASRHR